MYIFRIHRFSQPQMENMLKKKNPESSKMQTWICSAQATIYMAFTLYLQLFT